MPRKRAHVSLKTKLASALACLLPQLERDWHRQHGTTADEMIRFFEWDHIVLHALGGADSWENLDPKLKAPHREKSRRDTAIVAKIKRLRRKNETPSITGYLDMVRKQWDDTEARILRPKRKLQSRPFPKSKRTLRWKGRTP